MSRNYRDLIVWQRAHEFVLNVYRFTNSFPTDERFGLTSQLRRAAVSVPSNLVEGCGRGTDADLCRFCDIAMGSANEAEYQTLLATELGYLSDEQFQHLSDQIAQVKKMLYRFIEHLRRSS